jgi:hypothetical protein
MVSIKLVDFWQVKPEGIKQLQNLSTLRIYPKTKKAKGKRPLGAYIKLVGMTGDPGNEYRSAKSTGKRKYNPKFFRLLISMRGEHRSPK